MQLQDIQSRAAMSQRPVCVPSGRQKFIRGAALMLSLCLAAHGAATCAATRYVGDTSSDSACTDNDIQSAINNAGVGDTILISGEHVYTNQTLTIGQGLTLLGNGGHCGDALQTTTVPLITLNGGNSSVIDITGNGQVILKNLEITGGKGTAYPGGSATSGGGIEVKAYGNGSLTLDTVSVNLNKADNGGGIDVSLTGSGNFVLTLKANTVISNNSATAGGGGIKINGDNGGAVQLDMTAPQIWIYNNHATGGYGGGINMVGNSQANIASSGFQPVGGVIYQNSAAYGGGIAATGDGDGRPVVNFYTTDAANPTAIQSNSASVQGGGIYLSDYSSGISENYAPLVGLFDFQIIGNSAPTGAAIYMHHESSELAYGGTGIWLNYPEGYPYPAGSARCTPSLNCNSISNNVTQDSNGATIYLEPGDAFIGQGFIMRSNTGGAYLIAGGTNASDANGFLLLQSCLLADNTVSKELVDSPFATIVNCTIAHNSIGGTVFYTGPAGTFELDDSIIDQGSTTTWSHDSSATSTIQYVLAGEITSLSSGTQVRQGAPSYVNAAGGDYHLQANSPGVDFAVRGGGPSGFNGPTTDLDGNPRDVDLPDIPNVYGPRDLGAYEVQNEAGFTGVCGPANGMLLSAEPSDPDVMCTAGSVGGPATTPTGWSWTCGSGSNGSTVVQCSATQAKETLELNVSQVPTSGTIGLAFSGKVVFGNLGTVGFSPSATLTVTSQPDGLSLGTCNAGGVPPQTGRSCTISGTPTTAGTFNATFTLTDPASSAQVTAFQTITIAPATPDLAVDASGLPGTGTVGMAYTSSVSIKNIGTATASSTATFTITGLPPGIAPTCGSNAFAGMSPGSSGSCTVSGTPTISGTYTVTATATDPADTDTANNSATTTIVIGNATTRTATTTTLNATPTNPTAGQSITFTTTVDPTSSPAPTGTVAIGGGGQSCTATLTAISTTTSSGQCALTFASAGTYTISAAYSGDTIYAPSNATLSVVVNASSAPSTVVSAPTLDRWAWLVLMSGLCGLAVFRQRRSNP
jgi:hypothetical protein